MTQESPAHPVPLSVEDVAHYSTTILDECRTVVVGMDEALPMALASILAGGHVLFEDLPGLGKTMAARCLATTLGLEFTRLQCTPDLLPSDVTGSSVWDPTTGAFTFRPGPVFTGLLLADEINRAAPRTQAALLEAMSESQVSVEGITRKLPSPFHMIATSNPVEFEGTFPLPEAQLDRFMVRLAVGTPTHADEFTIINRRLTRQRPDIDLSPVIDAQTLLAMQVGVEQVGVEQSVVDYAIAIAQGTRAAEDVLVGASPRGTQSLVLLARAWAVMHGRSVVTPDDVAQCAIPALAHRLTLSTSAWANGVKTQEIMRDVLNRTPAPCVVRQ
ncbi:AAA family ATPase [Actinomyces vulturis]|uniref:AAA family ATPase n=1 Tax=Actinomyces vulturis TaxID=1857645 RepID=UPI00083619A1|nr:MoxR family ATPase [Actinomyces vulturis]